MDQATFIELMAYFMIFCAVACFACLCTGIRAPYGRYNMAYQFTVPAKLDWFLQESPSLLLPVYFLLSSKSYEGFFLLTLFIGHYAQRTLYYPFVMKSTKGSPVHVFISAVAFTIYNGYMQGLWHSKFYSATSGFFTHPLTYIGTIIFICGMGINIQSDSILRNLRKPGEVGYKIPRGGLFEYVSGANYFGEIIEWLGFALAARSLPALAFAIFTISNIGPRAIQHHQYYLEKFEDYPKNRKALIPLVL